MGDQELEKIKQTLAPHEVLEENIKCPHCGGPVVTSYGYGISCTSCLDQNCNWCDYDYDFSGDDFDG